MRLNDHVILQYIEAGGRDDFYNLVDESSGVEFVLTIEEAGRLLVGLGWFVKQDHRLADAVSEAAREAAMQVGLEWHDVPTDAKHGWPSNR